MRGELYIGGAGEIVLLRQFSEGSPLMSLAVDQRIVDEIRLIRAEREERFRRDMEEIDRQYDRHLDRLYRTDRWSFIVVLLCAAAGLAVLAAAS